MHLAERGAPRAQREKPQGPRDTQESTAFLPCAVVPIPLTIESCAFRNGFVSSPLMQIVSRSSPLVSARIARGPAGRDVRDPSAFETRGPVRNSARCRGPEGARTSRPAGPASAVAQSGRSANPSLVAAMPRCDLCGHLPGAITACEVAGSLGAKNANVRGSSANAYPEQQKAVKPKKGVFAFAPFFLHRDSACSWVAGLPGPIASALPAATRRTPFLGSEYNGKLLFRSDARGAWYPAAGGTA
jgi:hypothetical protein